MFGPDDSDDWDSDPVFWEDFEDTSTTEFDDDNNEDD
jgi:hypothetical protein